jgi:hypothetical protein
VESSRPQPSPLVELAVCLYVLGTGVTALFSIGWSMAPFENSEPDTTHELVLVGLSLCALAAAAAMTRAVWRDQAAHALAPLAVSLVCVAAWVVALPPT